MAKAKHQEADGLLETGQRRAWVIRMRRTGATYESIADLAVKKFGADRLPSGWNGLYAYKDVKRELDKIRKEVTEEAKEVLSLELQRLDELYLTMHALAIKGDTSAALRALQIMERRAKLLGLDMPEKFAATTPDGEQESGFIKVVVHE